MLEVNVAGPAETAGLWIEEMSKALHLGNKKQSLLLSFSHLMLFATTHSNDVSTADSKQCLPAASFEDRTKHLREDLVQLSYVLIWELICRWKKAGDLNKCLAACGIVVSEAACKLAAPLQEFTCISSEDPAVAVQKEMLQQLRNSKGIRLFWPLKKDPVLKQLCESSIELLIGHARLECENSLSQVLCSADRIEFAHIVINSLSDYLSSLEREKIKEFWGNIRKVIEGKEARDKSRKRMVTWTLNDTAKAAGLDFTSDTRDELKQYRKRVKSGEEIAEKLQKELFYKLV